MEITAQCSIFLENNYAPLSTKEQTQLLLPLNYYFFIKINDIHSFKLIEYIDAIQTQSH